ncbi:hypothetical protein L596_021596 [Steinernema carpocapsae]|uniref:Peptidase C1A papain C-terminal domain-containing protein n=1 Tax=Steinernema carpocapsae TaxID=34508 RepID=A0A4U5MK16_STECR|nr:hypothetical protein L596_021596 [Steinernema carpocapsae]
MHLRSALFALFSVFAVSQARFHIPHRLIEAAVSTFYDLDHLPPPAEYNYDKEEPKEVLPLLPKDSEEPEESAEYESDLLPEEEMTPVRVQLEQDIEHPVAEYEEDLSRKFLRKPCLVKRKNRVYNFVKSYPRAWEHPGFEASLPKEWDWRNVSGVNYCSPNRNQHIPVYCGSCWVFGSTGALNDRFNVARKNRWPMTMVSPQEIIDCNGHGTCQGGEAADVFEHAKTQGLVEEGCNNYKAVNESKLP